MTIYSVCAFTAGLLTASCSSNDEIVSETENDLNTQNVEVVFKTQEPGATRVAFGGYVDSTSTVRTLQNAGFYWSDGDKLKICSPFAAVASTGRKVNNMEIDVISEDRKSATFKSPKSGINLAIGKDTYLVLAQNPYTDKGKGNTSGVAVDANDAHTLIFTCDDGVKAILGSDSIPIDFFNGSIFTEFVKIPGDQVKLDANNKVTLTGQFQVLTPVVCFQLPVGTTASEFKYNHLQWTEVRYDMSSGTWTKGGTFVDKTIGITQAAAGIIRNRIVYVPVLPGSINDEASISCDGYTCSLKGLKDAMGTNNVLFLGTIGKSSHWVKDATTK